jgi:hypothetical protein
MFQLVVFLILCLALLWRLCWFPFRPSSSKGAAKRTTLPRLRHRPAAQTMAPPVDSPPLPRRVQGLRLRMSRPWPEVKSRRGAPKRRDTEGFACPNPQCASFGITDAHIHALVGDGKHGRPERIQTLRCQACQTTFTSRRNTPFFRLKTPSRAGSQWCSLRWLKGWILRLPNGSQGYRQATIPTWLSRAGSHAQTLHERFFSHLHLPHLQVDELRTRLRNAKQVRLALAGH